jgi:hypothetical protein
MSKVSSKQIMNMAAIFAVLITAIIFMSGREATTEHARGRPRRYRPSGRTNVRKAPTKKAVEAVRKSYSRTAKRLGIR